MLDQYPYSIHPKPTLRGKIHFAAFFASSFCLLLFFLASLFHKFNLGILIYLITQILQFGASSFYHIPDWNHKTRQFLRQIDHSCIFLLISGTQTSVILNSIPMEKMASAWNFIKVSWTISILGIARLIFIKKLYDIFDLVCYIGHGLVILPFAKTLTFLKLFDLIMICLGGAFYITGGVIYGMEKPNPVPGVFGYHEIFHMFTVLANGCFGVVILKGYIVSLLDALWNK